MDSESPCCLGFTGLPRLLPLPLHEFFLLALLLLLPLLPSVLGITGSV